MLCENITNGVSRYAEMLYNGLPEDSYDIIYLKFVFLHRIALPKRIQHKKYVEMIIPLPISSEEIIENNYWLSEYNRLVEHIIAPYLERDFIFHIQTMNLISLAVFLRQKYNCRIVSHIHCIPWKYKYSTDQLLFNQIYYRLNISDNINETNLEHFITTNEFDIIRDSDAVICVTQGSKRYYEKYLHAIPERMFCIYNGIRDELNESTLTNIINLHRKEGDTIRLLYVGNVTKDKGFPFVLDALRIVNNAGYKFVLSVAGTIDSGMRELIEQDYYDLDIKLLGHIDYSKLQKLYQSSQIGLISSLFEQCSYAALEMQMFGLPVVYSGIEELHEVFGHDNDLYIPVNFSIHSSLCLDVDVFAKKIIKLICSPDLRKEISLNMRRRFIDHFTQEQMIQKTINVYNKLYQK